MSALDKLGRAIEVVDAVADGVEQSVPVLRRVAKWWNQRPPVKRRRARREARRGTR